MYNKKGACVYITIPGKIVIQALSKSCTLLKLEFVDQTFPFDIGVTDPEQFISMYY